MNDIVCFSDMCINLAHVKKVIFKGSVLVYFIDGSDEVIDENKARPFKQALQMKGIFIE